MKIVILNPRVMVETFGAPAMESFELTPKMLKAWNVAKADPFAFKANENWNEAQGYPCATARKWLRKLHDAKFGVCNPSGKLTWADIKAQVE